MRTRSPSLVKVRINILKRNEPSFTCHAGNSHSLYLNLREAGEVQNQGLGPSIGSPGKNRWSLYMSSSSLSPSLFPVDEFNPLQTQPACDPALVVLLFALLFALVFVVVFVPVGMIVGLRHSVQLLTGPSLRGRFMGRRGVRLCDLTSCLCFRVRDQADHQGERGTKRWRVSCCVTEDGPQSR